jgi:DNA-binding transcriptional LysR family regulator
MREIDINRLDLNLLRVFVALWEEGSVTAAANRLGLGQPSISHALGRLREAVDDQLFVRSHAGMVPTFYAEAIAEAIKEKLSELQGILNGGRGFDPATSNRIFRLILSDLGELTFMPTLMAYLAENAPDVKIVVMVIPRSQYRETLEAGKADLALGQILSGFSDFFQQKMFEEPFHCFFRAGHEIEHNLTLETFLKAEHVVIGSPMLGDQHVKRALGVQAAKRQIRLEVPHYTAPPPILAKTNLIAVLPRIIANYYDFPEKLSHRPCPFEIEPVVMRQFWHERTNGDVGCKWLRQTLTRLFRRND